MAEKKYIEVETAIENAISQMRVSKSELCMRERLLNIPAADVRPVVLCKNCVHYEMGVCLKIYDDGAANKDAWQERKPDDYCSYGEDRNVPTNCGADMRGIDDET